MTDVAGLIESLDALKRSQRFKGDAALIHDDLEHVSDEVLSALLNRWASYSWDLDIGFVDVDALHQLCEWVLGIALQRHHSSVSVLSCDRALQEGVETSLAVLEERSKRFVAPKVDDDNVRLRRILEPLCARVVREIVFGKSAAPWTSILAPRLRSVSFPRKKKVFWKSNAVDFAEMGFEVVADQPKATT
jgi:hypothetical protein